MSIEVDDFKYLQGKNDSEYIVLLEETLRRQREITTKAIAKISQLSSKNRWLTCNEFIPPDGEYILIFEGCIVKNCPLQLDVIERGIDLWTNPGDIVLDPFAGIGSVPYQAQRPRRVCSHSR